MLIGRWGLEAPSPTMRCYVVLTFEEDYYGAEVLCSLSGGGWADEVELGDYEATEDTIDFTPTHASCALPDRDHGPDSAGYTVNDSRLRVAFSSGGLVLEKLADDPNELGPEAATGVVATGCINPEAFTPGDIEEL